MYPKTPTHAAERATAGFPRRLLSFGPSFSWMVEREKMIRNSPQNTKATATQAGVVAVGPVIKVGTLWGSADKSKEKGISGILEGRVSYSPQIGDVETAVQLTWAPLFFRAQDPIFL